MFSTVVSTLTTVSGNAVSNKTFTLAQIVPDVAVGRQIILKSVSMTLANASAPATSPGAMVQIQLEGQPWSNGIDAGGRFASMPFRSLNSTNRTALRVVPNLPGQQSPVQLDRAGV